MLYSLVTSASYLHLVEREENQESLKKIILPPKESNTYDEWQSGVYSKLHKEGKITLKKAVASYLNKRYYHEKIKFTPKKEEDGFFNLFNSQQTMTFDTHLGRSKICDLEIKAIKRQDGSIYIIGNDQNFHTYEYIPSKWPSLELSRKRVIENIKEKFHSDFRIKVKDKCYLSESKELKPVWIFSIHLNGLPYEYYADDNRLYKKERKFFHLDGVTGKTQVYEENSTDSNLVEYDIQLDGDGTLKNSFFETFTNPTSKYGHERAYSKDHSFIYTPSDTEFNEVSVFTHANNMLSYFKSIGYVWAETNNIILNIYAPSRGSNGRNNALYVPSNESFNGKTSINIGDGDGHDLQNLLTDTDVVSHEFGHHVQYRTLKTASGESLILHEGIADFFAFAKTDDACLGESICPEGSDSCFLISECLRTADNNLRLNDSDYSSMTPHHKSQLLSGMLWDLKADLDLNYLAKLTQKSIDFLIVDSGFYHFILALMTADEYLGQGMNSCKIYDAAINRGFGTMLENLDCKEVSQWPEDQETTENLRDEDEKEALKKNEATCGSISKINKLPFTFILFSLLFPFLLILCYQSFGVAYSRRT